MCPPRNGLLLNSSGQTKSRSSFTINVGDGRSFAGRVALYRRLEKTGIPGLVVEADMADPRAYAEESVRTRVEAFLETLQAG
ncbi:MAG: 2-hydroxyacyl-CoA dehydratase [Desulfitobacteriaceae bacterium]